MLVTRALIAIYRNEAGNPRRSGKMWKPLIVKRSTSAANKLHAAQVSVTLVPRAKEASMAGRTGLPKSVLGLATGVVCWPRSGSPYRLHPPRTRRPEGRRHSTRQRTARGTPGSWAPTARSGPRTSRRSRWARRSSTSRWLSSTGLHSDIVIYVKRGSVATGHCRLPSTTGDGLCTISDGTGTLDGFQLRVRVTADSSLPKHWHWDGTYSFNRG